MRNERPMLKQQSATLRPNFLEENASKHTSSTGDPGVRLQGEPSKIKFYGEGHRKVNPIKLHTNRKDMRRMPLNWAPRCPIRVYPFSV